MMEAYGKAVVDERLKPRHLAELAAYLRHEYGPGTELGFVFAEIANGAAPRRKPTRTKPGALRALASALKGLVPGNGTRRKAKATNPTR